jgi:hypothetical protein
MRPVQTGRLHGWCLGDRILNIQYLRGVGRKMRREQITKWKQIVVSGKREKESGETQELVSLTGFFRHVTEKLRRELHRHARPLVSTNFPSFYDACISAERIT